MSVANPIRLLVSDVDGTLVLPDKTLSQATIAAVASLKQAGLPMTLISARPPSGMYWIAESLGIDGPIGAFNGGTLFKRDGTILQRSHLDRAVAEAVIDLIRHAGITCWLFAHDQWLSSSSTDPYIPREVKSAGMEPIITDDFSAMLERADKIVGVSSDAELLVRLEAEAIALVGNGATIARSQPYFLDVTAPTANKGDGVAFLADAFGVPLDRVAVIGDQANDLPMFARAGLSIAMGQATDAVRSRAMLTTESNAADGVARAIERIILPAMSNTGSPGLASGGDHGDATLA